MALRSRLGTMGPHAAGLGGWTLSGHHSYDPTAEILHLGDGSRREAKALRPVVTTIIGAGSRRANEAPSLPAADVTLFGDSKHAFAPDGSVFVADDARQVILKVSPAGLLTIAAGTWNTAGFAGDSGAATTARFNGPRDVAVRPDGGLVIADRANHRVRHVSPEGVVSTLAGTGTAGFSGDGGPATAARLASPQAVAVGPDGAVYIADSENFRIRRVALDGTIQTVAGSSGFCGPLQSTEPCGDGGPATGARLGGSGIRGLDVGPDGAICIAEFTLNRIRKVSVDGRIQTVAGSGVDAISGDGGAARFAGIRRPWDVVVGRDGALFIAHEEQVRRVDPDGTVTTAAGNGLHVNNTFLGEGGPANAARVAQPRGVALSPEGNLTVASYGAGRLLRVSAALPSVRVGEIAVSAENGKEIYVFSDGGKHLRTVDTETRALRWQFGYDARGELASATDVDGRATVITRDAAGRATAITSPDGVVTSLTIGDDGYLSGVENAEGEAWGFVYTPSGLLSQWTTPRGFEHHATFDAEGRLLRDDDPAGGSLTLSRARTATSSEVTATTALGRATRYRIDEAPNRDEIRTNTFASGTTAEETRRDNGVRTVKLPDGTRVDTTWSADPRFGLQAPVLSRVERMPSGLTRTTTHTRLVTLANPRDPLSLTTRADVFSRNGRTTTVVYDAATRRTTVTSPAGRVRRSFVDPRGRTTRTEVAGILPVDFTYDGQGRLTTTTQGVRTTSQAYDSFGFLAAVTDPIARTERFVNDGIGRVTQAIRPDLVSPARSSATESLDACENVVG